MKWTDEETEALKKLWAAGDSTAEIALALHKAFGSYFSRNAVIGKAHRLKLPEHPEFHADRRRPTPKKPTNPDQLKPFRRPQIMRLPRAQLTKEAERVQEVLLNNYEDDLKIPQKQRKTIMQLTSKTCRWPVGDVRDAGFFFCGGNTSGEVYCQDHAARAQR